MSEPQLPQSLLRVLASLTEWFTDQHVSYALIGGAGFESSRPDQLNQALTATAKGGRSRFCGRVVVGRAILRLRGDSNRAGITSLSIKKDLDRVSTGH